MLRNDILTAIHFVDFELSEEKGDFLKTTICHYGLNGGSNALICTKNIRENQIKFRKFLKYRYRSAVSAVLWK